MIQYTCENCGAEVESPDEMGGGEDRCPDCGATCHVPLSKAQEKVQAEEGRAKKRASAEAKPKAMTPADWWNEALERKNNPQQSTVGSQSHSEAHRHRKKYTPGETYPRATFVASMLSFVGIILMLVTLFGGLAAADETGAAAAVIATLPSLIGGLVLLGLSSVISMLARIAWKLEHSEVKVSAS